MVFTDLAEALVYSLPFLEHLHSLQLPQTSLSYVTHPFQPVSRKPAHPPHTDASPPIPQATTSHTSSTPPPASPAKRSTARSSQRAASRPTPRPPSTSWSAAAACPRNPRPSRSSRRPSSAPCSATSAAGSRPGRRSTRYVRVLSPDGEVMWRHADRNSRLVLL